MVTQGSQSLALGFALAAAPQLVNYRRLEVSLFSPIDKLKLALHQTELVLTIELQARPRRIEYNPFHIAGDRKRECGRVRNVTRFATSALAYARASDSRKPRFCSTSQCVLSLTLVSD